jgi:hypothetical protein
MDPLDLFTSTYGLHAPSGSRHTTAVLILPGLQSWRLSQPCWEEYSHTVWVAGTAGDPTYSADEVRSLLKKGLVEPADLTHVGYARCTPDQIVWARRMLLKQAHITNLVMTTAAYHLPRCILTFIKDWQRHGDQRRLRIGALPTIAPEPLHAFGFAGDYDKSHSVASELERIEKYQRTRDVATAEEFAQFVIDSGA